MLTGKIYKIFHKLKTPPVSFSGKAADCCPKKLANISFEVTNICNADCSFCAYRYMTRKKEIMDFEFYKDVLVKCIKNGIEGISLGTIAGDPLEDPFIIERIKVAKSLGHFRKITFFTNLIALGRHDVRELLQSGVTDITISTSFEGAEFYRRYFGVDKYDETIKNIKILCNLNRSSNRPVNINIELRMPFKIPFLCKDKSIYKEILPQINHISFNYFYDDWFGLIDKKDIPARCSLKKKNSKNKKTPCAYLSGKGLIIMLDGKINLCSCRNFNADQQLIIGDIKEDSLTNIWNGRKMRTLWNNWINGEIPGLCRKCNWYSKDY